MKLLLPLTGLLLAAAITATATTEVAEREDGVVLAEVVSLDHNTNLEIAKASAEALEKFFDLFNNDFLKEGGGVGKIAEIVAKGFSFIGAILALVKLAIGANTESPEIQLMREQFSMLNKKMDLMSAQIQEVKELIQWESTRVKFSQCEMAIISSSRRLERYVSAKTDEERETYRNQVIIDFLHKPTAARDLYNGIMDQNSALSDNLIAAVNKFTDEHRRKVTSFLLVVSQIILRGSQVEIAYHSLVHGSATVVEKEWKDKMTKLMSRIQLEDERIANEWHARSVTYVDKVIQDEKLHSMTNSEYSQHLYNVLADRFPGRHWFAVVYSDVWGFDNHCVSTCTGLHRFRVAGGRNVVVSSSDPKTSLFTRSDWENALVKVESAGHRTRDARTWWDEIDKHWSGDCDHAAFRGAICWGCRVSWRAPQGRVAHRTITVGEYVNTIVFG